MRGANPVPTEVRACSACAGDYEDPERTAWRSDASEEEGAEETSADNAGQSVPREGFPVREK